MYDKFGLGKVYHKLKKNVSHICFQENLIANVVYKICITNLVYEIVITNFVQEKFITNFEQ